MFVSARSDAVLVVTVGLGGTWTEALATRRSSRCQRTFASRTGSARCAVRICSAVAGAEALDVDAAAELAARLGDLLLERNLRLIELNPVVVHRRGCVAVDALAR